MEKRTVYFDSELRAAGGVKPLIKGFIPYMSLSKPLGPGGPRERLLPNVFAESLKSGETVSAFWNHNSSQPIGTTANGSLRLQEDRQGLHYEISPDLAISWVADAYRSIKSGMVSGTSFGFSVESEDWTEENDETIREVIKASLHEVSPTIIPAYTETAITARNFKGENNMKDISKERRQIYLRMCQLNDKEDMNTEEGEEYLKLEKRYDEIQAEINRPHILPDVSDPNGGGSRQRGYFSRNGGEAIDLTKVFGLSKRHAVEYQCRRSSENEIHLYDKYLRGGLNVLNTEQRSLFMDDDLQGGFLVAPEKFVAELIQDVRNETFALDICRVIPVTGAHSLGVPTLDSEPDDADWTSELRTGTEDTAMKFGKRELYPHPLAKRIKVSKRLLRVAQVPVESIVREALAYKLAVPIETAFFSGDGVDQPLGCMVNSNLGIDSSRDVSEGNTTSAIKADNLINCKYSLKAQYRKNAKWAFHKDAIAKIRKLKTGDGEYIWKSGLSDRPDTILEIPFLESEYQLNTFTSGSYVGILGDFRRYWWAVSLSQQIQVLTELYAEQNLNGYISRSELDGQPQTAEAFVRVKLAS